MNPSASFFPKAFVSDVDGTLTDGRRRINTDAILALRRLIDDGVPVVLASGNTVCSMTFLSKMIGTEGTIICENGGVYQISFGGEIHLCGRREKAWEAFHLLEEHFTGHGKSLTLYSAADRYADVAFARDVDVDEVRELLSDMPVRVLDTNFAIHLQSPGVNKGTALLEVADALGIEARDFLAVGDSENDIEMLQNAGLGVAVANGQTAVLEAADYVTKNMYGDGVVEAINRFFAYCFKR